MSWGLAKNSGRVFGTLNGLGMNPQGFNPVMPDTIRRDVSGKYGLARTGGYTKVYNSPNNYWLVSDKDDYIVGKFNTEAEADNAMRMGGLKRLSL